MKKYVHIIAKALFSLILIFSAIGITGVFGEPARELYTSDLAFDFIQILTEVGYINYMMFVVHIIALIALWTKREAVAALLELPITLNIVAFHAMIDGGLFTAGAVLGNVMLLINLYLLWKNRVALKVLAQPRSV